MGKIKRSKVKSAVCKEMPASEASVDFACSDVPRAETSALESTDAAKSFCEQIRTNVERLSDAECQLLLQMVKYGREIRAMAKAASRIWGEEFDGGTAEIAGPMLYRQILKRKNSFDEVHRPAPSIERIGQINGYDVDFIKPDFIYRVRGNGLCRSFSPRYMPISGMDIEDVMYVLDIIEEYETKSELARLV